MPTLQYVAEGNTSYRDNEQLGIIELPDANAVSPSLIFLSVFAVRFTGQLVLSLSINAFPVSGHSS